MKFHVHSHCGGDKALPSAMQAEIEAAIGAITINPRNGAATKVRDAFLGALKTLGWPGELAVSRESDITITSCKSEVGLCCQTGNMARIYADLIKLQTLYLDKAIRGAAIVLPSTPMAKLLGSNIAQANRLERELSIFKKAYHVPTLVYALELA